MDLMNENLGIVPRQAERKFKRLKRRDPESSTSNHRDVSKLFDDDDDDDLETRESGVPIPDGRVEDVHLASTRDSSNSDLQKKRDFYGYVSDDEMDDFIVDDEDDDKEGSVKVNELERKKRKQERRKTIRSRGQDIGLNQEAWADIEEIFGDGADYDFAMTVKVSWYFDWTFDLPFFY